MIALGAALLTMLVSASVFLATTLGNDARVTWSAPGSPAPAVLAAPPTPEPSPTPIWAFPPPTVNVELTGYSSWEALDRRSGARYGSENRDQTAFSESMIKVWIAADFLNRLGPGASPDARRADQLVRMIRDSNNGAAESLWRASGGDASIRRMISACGLVDTRVYPAWWSQTFISARDAVTLGECIADGTGAGPTWTPWLLDEMRNVRGTVEDQPYGGRWGVIDALAPDVAATVAIKNGWTLHKDNTWNVNCLAIHNDWIIAVMSDYAGSRGLAYGARHCAAVATQVLWLAGGVPGLTASGSEARPSEGEGQRLTPSNSSPSRPGA